MQEEVEQKVVSLIVDCVKLGEQELKKALAKLVEQMKASHQKHQLENLYNQQAAAKAEVGKPFPQERKLAEKTARLIELDTYSVKNGIILLVIAFLISPLGLPMMAVWMLGKLQGANSAMKAFLNG